MIAMHLVRRSVGSIVGWGKAFVQGIPRPVVAALLVFVATCCNAAEVTWKMHTINAQSEFPACAAFDVDHDGDIDIYSGGWWYEAPTWKKHKVRDVEVIRGRFDDYSNQPMDCNGDGWTDIISVNYRSETIYWIEHPGKKLGQQDWTAHVIDKPGPSETGRLHDIDGDGDLDILPNGTTYAAWYEFTPERKDDGTVTPKWEKHELPKEAAGHGIGYHRRHIPGKNLTIDEWISAKAIVMKETSEMIPRDHTGHFFKIHPDASVPILGHEVDQQHGYDLIWGRGHRTGLYWQRQVEFVREWQLLPIDTSWSQCHAPMLADIDLDGTQDIVAGKRYMGHEGKDPGEFDPLVIYWYRYDTETTTWHRNVIHEAGPAGIDLDGKAIDIDGDKDLDIVAPSRNGLYYFENLLFGDKTTNVDQASPVRMVVNDHQNLLVYGSSAGDLKPVKTPAEWALRRWNVVKNMSDVMGSLPSSSNRVPLLKASDHLINDDELPNYTRSRFLLPVDVAGNKVGITLLIPSTADLYGQEHPRKLLPAMLCLHPTSVDHGKKIVTGEVESKNRAYAHELAERGYVCICPDYPTMGENPFDLQTTHKHYQSGTMKAIWDNIRCLDVLESLPYVDPDRIGVIGHSLGGHNGMFTACFDQRIKCVVTSCGFTPFHDYYGGKLDGWTQDRYMPRIRDVYHSDPDKMPFDFYEVLGALAPRPVFINAPLHDDNFEVGGVKKAVAEAQKVYDLLGKPAALQARYPDCAHDFPEDTRQEVYDWLDKQLK